MSKRALVLLAKGCEEIEFTVVVDVLRRAGVEVTVAGLQGSNVVECSRQVQITPDVKLEEVVSVKHDAVVLPGGMKASEAFGKDQTLGQLLKQQDEEKRIVAAICAAPTALKAHTVCNGKNLTCYPTFQKSIAEGGQYKYVDKKVVVDDNLITSQGPGTAFDFALAIVEKLVGKDTAATVSKQLLLS